ncbi:hypothetical protein F5X68DRAFT_273859 [Plectosphaerella plurivora]|uniref:Uncharacterized protein n=1 Tax=Plectosphaerella plurivora TaxID=936078 RepID=A0A9P8VIH6_9PEZI|nr:hypothetical protein F5X68DRAFT_273859 [Plectosphaerella plurivora]
MDAHALLTSHGWRGTGHSLHATDDKIGLAKPLLLNRRDGNKGLGQKAHYTSDMWWMNAFDEQLQGLQQTTSKDGKIGVIQTVSNGRINSIEQGMGGRWKLSGNFVRGGFLQGTVDMLEASESNEEDTSSSEDDKSTGASTPVEADNNTKTETKEERRKRKAEKAARRAERDAKRKRKELEKAAKREAKKQRATGAEPSSSASKKDKTKSDKREETKEERRARRESKRLRRAAREAEKSA